MRLFLALLIGVALDLASYCKGSCKTRYMDGTYIKDKNQCACIDYQNLNLDRQTEVPGKTKKDFDPPTVYDGVDQMTYPKEEY